MQGILFYCTGEVNYELDHEEQSGRNKQHELQMKI